MEPFNISFASASGAALEGSDRVEVPGPSALAMVSSIQHELQSVAVDGDTRCNVIF
jgi:hypothetical protein